MRLRDKTAVVTGAASGFGRGIAERFAKEGAKVVLADIAEDAGREAAAGLGTDSALFVQADVSQDEDMRGLVGAATERFGRIDIFVNNAGITHARQPMLDVDEATFERIFAVNVKSIYLSAVHAVPIMRSQGGGVVINIASTAGVRPRPGLTWYNGSKGAVITLTKSMALELAPDGIRVCGINPVVGETGLTEMFMGEADTPENRKKYEATIPLGRFSTPRDVANAALYLASDEADLLTGLCLEVDGGRCV
ncbi:MAG: SDR family oxidoreductase [Pseudomonadota bacterium]